MILIDNRTGSKELARYFKAQHKLVHLDFADFAFSGNGPEGLEMIGIERKTITDLVSSMHSGRLSGHQLVGMRDRYTRVYLLVEGRFKPHPESGVLQIPRNRTWVELSVGQRYTYYTDVFAYCNTLTVMAGVIPLFTSTMRDTAMLIRGLYRWWQKDWSKHKAHIPEYIPPIKNPTLVKPGLLTRIIAQFDGVGWDRADKLARHFGTLLNFAIATEKELQKVKGIGKVLAARIKEEIGK